MSEFNLKRMRKDKIMRLVFVLAACLLTIIIVAIIVFMSQQGLTMFKEVTPQEFFLSAHWDPEAGKYGALSFIVGSLAVTTFALCLGAPLGIAGALFLSKIASPLMKSILQPAINIYMAIPSVVYGFFGLTVIVPWVRGFFGVTGGFGIFTAGSILAIMILPTIVSLSADALATVPQTLEEGSLALGATRWQTLWHIVLPSAWQGLVTAVILGMARAIGETMAVQMVIGNTPQLAKSLFSPTSTLPSEIVVEMGNTPFGSTWGNSLFFMALVLLGISLLLILLVRSLGKGRMA
ncbi:MAG: phosphate ABC transporter permease subunit PstC [Acidaminococcaceae bacterium]|jgi:phosphate transport system permease protein|nr:phosphate ABC transporter permease subunit PstC [Acidaminococcaceae bacterium]